MGVVVQESVTSGFVTFTPPPLDQLQQNSNRSVPKTYLNISCQIGGSSNAAGPTPPTPKTGDTGPLPPAGGSGVGGARGEAPAIRPWTSDRSGGGASRRNGDAPVRRGVVGVQGSADGGSAWRMCRMAN
jgi:hypothetical protein